MGGKKIINVIVFSILLDVIGAIHPDYFLNLRDDKNFHPLDLRYNIPGEPGVDYPVHFTVPITNFSCNNRHEGYYADVQTRCQVFRICANTDIAGNGFGFLCPNGTIFSQKEFVCDWYKNVDCDKSETFYSMNEELGISIRNKEEMMKEVQKMITYPIQNIIQRARDDVKDTLITTKTNSSVKKHKHHNFSHKIFTPSPNHETDNRNTLNENSINKFIKQSQKNQLKNNQTIPNIIEEQTTEIISLNKSEFENTIKNTENLSPPKQVYISNLGELSSDYGTSFDPKTSKIISVDYESEKTSDILPEKNENTFKKPFQNIKPFNLARRINTFLEPDKASSELSTNQSRNQQFSKTNYALDIQNVSNKNLNEEVSSMSSYYQRNPSQSNGYREFSNTLNLAFQPRMDEGSGEVVSVPKILQPLQHVQLRTLAEYVNAAVQTTHSEFDTEKQFKFEESDFPRGRKQLNFKLKTNNENTESMNNDRHYLPPHEFIPIKPPNFSSSASGFRLNNLDSFSMTENVLSKLSLNETISINNQLNMTEKQDRANKRNKIDTKINSTKQNRTTRILDVKDNKVKKIKIIKIANNKGTGEKADKLLLQGIHQALYENEASISKVNSSSETSTTKTLKTNNTTPATTTISTDKISTQFPTPTPVPVIELTNTQFPNSFLFLNKNLKPTTTATTQKTTFRNLRNTSTTKQGRSRQLTRQNNRSTTPKSNTTVFNYHQKTTTSNNGSNKIHRFHFGNESNHSSARLPTETIDKTVTAGFLNNQQLSKPTQTIQTRTRNRGDNNDKDKILTDLTPLAFSYGTHRSNNRIRNETKSTGHRRSNKTSNSFRNITTTSASKHNKISSSSSSSSTTSSTSSLMASSRQTAKKSFSNNSKNETNLQLSGNVRKTMLDRNYKNNTSFPNFQASQSKPVSTSAVNVQEKNNNKKPSSTYVELPGTKVKIAKSEEHGHFSISNDPNFTKIDKNLPIFQRPIAELNKHLIGTGTRNNFQKNPYINVEQQNVRITDQPFTNFFLPFPTISPPRQHQQQSQTFVPSNIQYQNNNFKPHFSNIQFTTEKPILGIETNLEYSNNFNTFPQIPIDNFQLPQRKLDIVENPEKERSLYSGVSSYNVPLSSVGTLPADTVII